MRWWWRCVLLIAAIASNNLITGSLGQDSRTPAPTDSADQGAAEEPTASQATDPPDSPDTPAPTDGAEAKEEEEGDDQPDTIEEDTPNDSTPSPNSAVSITDEIGADPTSSGESLVAGGVRVAPRCCFGRR